MKKIDKSSIPSSKKTKTLSAQVYFERYVGEKGLSRAKCINCGNTYIVKDDSGTINVNKKCVERDVFSYLSLNQEKYREKVAQTIVVNNYPFLLLNMTGLKICIVFFTL